MRFCSDRRLARRLQIGANDWGQRLGPTAAPFSCHWALPDRSAFMNHEKDETHERNRSAPFVCFVSFVVGKTPPKDLAASGTWQAHLETKTPFGGAGKMARTLPMKTDLSHGINTVQLEILVNSKFLTA